MHNEGKGERTSWSVSPAVISTEPEQSRTAVTGRWRVLLLETRGILSRATL